MEQIYLKNKITGDMKQVEKGFSWPVFFFGWLYLFIKGCYKQGVVILFLDLLIFIYATTHADQGGFVLLILFIHSYVAYNWHLTYIDSLEKKDYKAIPIDAQN